MATYLIRDFPDDLHKAAKLRAVEEEISIQELILRAIREYLSKKRKG
jgi:predicted HicB family RNase H-like nuclease